MQGFFRTLCPSCHFVIKNPPLPPRFLPSAVKRNHSPKRHPTQKRCLMQCSASGVVENSERHYVTLVSLFSAGIFCNVGVTTSFFKAVGGWLHVNVSC